MSLQLIQALTWVYIEEILMVGKGPLGVGVSLLGDHPVDRFLPTQVLVTVMP